MRPQSGEEAPGSDSDQGFQIDSEKEMYINAGNVLFRYPSDAVCIQVYILGAEKRRLTCQHRQELALKSLRVSYLHK